MLEPEHRRVTVPCRWSDFDIVKGPVRVVRRFGYPGHIDTEERVWLTFAGCEDGAQAMLNEQLLGNIAEHGAEFDITSLLQQRNRLEIAVAAPSEAAGMGEVALEVRRTAFLKNVRATPQGTKLHVAGDVVGHGDGPFDLYVIVGRSPAGYTTVRAGTRFQMEADLLEGSVRVELVQGALVWYSVTV